VTVLAHLALAALVAGTPPADPPTPEEAPGWRRPTPEPSTFMLAAGVGAAFPTGDAASGLAMSDLTRTQVVIGLEGGFRFTPAWMASVVFDMGLGRAGSRSQELCRAAGYSCDDAFTGSLGAHLRHALTPLAPTTGWIAVGSAWEFTEFSSNTSSATQVSFTGWQYLRLSGGWDLRNMHYYRTAFGVFGLVALGQYTSAKDVAGTHQISSVTSHAWVQLGVRLVLGP
jgi:hypothetical protein